MSAVNVLHVHVEKIKLQYLLNHQSDALNQGSVTPVIKYHCPGYIPAPAHLTQQVLQRPGH